MSLSQNSVKIISNKSLERKGYYLLSLSCPSNFKKAGPGQFIHVKITSGVDPLLRRPFSIHRIDKESKGKGFCVDVLYEVVGKGTALLSQKSPGDILELLGPLGKSFDYEDQRNTLPIIVCGGMGVAPLLFLAQKIVGLNPKKHNIKPIVLIGARAKKKIICEDSFRKLNCEVKIATDDGSFGFNGKVTDLFKKEIRKIYKQRERNEKKNKKAKESACTSEVMVYACGPMQMLTELAKICKIEKIPLQVSLEEFMGCGIGACLGCAIETKQGYKRVCKDGPVFLAEDINWRF